LIGEDIALETILDKDLGAVRTDASQLQQVLMNLAVNARDAMPRGGRLTIETRNVTLDEVYARQHDDVRVGEYVMITVSDNGEGMSREVQGHLFEPFFTTKSRGKGTGLGLAMVHGIVKQSGGSIGVYSEAGKGTTFKVYLPRQQQEERVHEIGTAAPGRREGGETILLVEDEDMIRQLAERVLTQLGYKVLQARQADEALRLHEERTEPVDLVITDVIMPGGMTGRDLAERILQRHPSVRVLYVSGYTDNAIVHHGMLDAGVNFLPKPFSVDSLGAKVREVLDKR
jgi:CheY-like chemotaxis protein